MRKKRLFFFATPPWIPRTRRDPVPQPMCASVCAWEPVEGRAGNGRALGPGTARRVACLHPCLLSILLCSCPVRVWGRAHVYVCLCGCVCQKRGESGFCTAPPKETALFVIFPSSWQREHQPDHLNQLPAWSIGDGGGGDISLSLSLCVFVLMCVCVCVHACGRVKGWGAERWKGQVRRGIGYLSL